MVFLNCCPMHKMYKLLLLLTVIQETSSPGKCANDRIFFSPLKVSGNISPTAENF